MASAASPQVNITPQWAGVQADILRIVDIVPDDKIDWSPKAELWNFRGILIHVSDARDRWMDRDIKDGEGYANIWTTAKSKDDLKRELGRTWARLGRLLSDQSKLDATYPGDGTQEPRTGHWIAFHLLEHDIHHRADILHYLALLGIETPDVGTP